MADDKPIPAEVIQLAIDSALKEASPFYEGMARPYIPLLQDRIVKDLQKAGYVVVDAEAWAKVKNATVT